MMFSVRKVRALASPMTAPLASSRILVLPRVGGGTGAGEG